jgi:hypothetical protein
MRLIDVPRLALPLATWALMAAGPGLALASVVTYSDATSFLAAVPAGSFTADFATLNSASGVSPIPSSTSPSTVPVSGGSPTVNYTLANGTAGSSLWTDKFFTPTVLTTTNSSESVIVDFTSGNVFGVGGGFVVTNASGERQGAIPITLTYFDGPNGTGNVLATGSVQSTIGSEQAPLPFFGLTSTEPLGSLVIAPGSGFIGVNNLTVAVPEPSAIALLGCAAVCGGWMWRRRSRQRVA